MLVQEIAEKTTLSDKKSVEAAMKALKNAPEHELLFFLVLRDTLNSTSANTRNAITLSVTEWERRTEVRRARLAYRTTVLSSVLALLGVVLGAFLGAYLTQ